MATASTTFTRARVRFAAVPTASRVVYACTTGYALLLTGFATGRYLAFQYSRRDLGNMSQAIWNTAHGHFLETTSDTGVAQVSRLGSHTDVFLALFAPLWRLWPNPLALLWVEGILVSAGALPVFWLARKHLNDQRAAAFLAIAYLLYPATQFNTYPATGFHAVSLAIPLILFAIWFLDEDRFVAFAAIALVAATTKETVPLCFALLGLWYGWRRRRWVVGGVIFATGLSLTLFAFLVVIPHYAGGASLFASRYPEFGDSPTSILRGVLTHPAAAFEAAATTHKLVFVALLLAPLLGLWALEPLLALAAVPVLAIDLLSNFGPQTSMLHPDDAEIVPFVFAATVFGLARLNRQTRRLAFYICAAIALTAIYSPLIALSHGLAQIDPTNARHQAKASAIAMVPPGVAVSATNQLGGYLSNRRRVTIFPIVGKASWVVIDVNDPTYVPTWYSARPGYAQSVIDRLRRSHNWRLVYGSEGVIVFRRQS